jgi:hypothetical protein
MHVLDAVMVPLEQLNSTDETASGTPSSGPSSTATNTANPTGAGTNAAVSITKAASFDWALWIFGAFVLASL